MQYRETGPAVLGKNQNSVTVLPPACASLSREALTALRLTKPNSAWQQLLIHVR